MIRLKRAVPAILLNCIYLLCLTGCPLPTKPVAEPVPVFSPDLPPEQYAVEIEKLLARANDPQASTDQTNIHLHLAVLCSSYKNPQPDYRTALNQVERHLRLHADSRNLYAANNLKFFLATITTAESKTAALENSLQAELKKANIERQRAEAEMRRLMQANQSLEEKIALLDTNNRELSSYNKSLIEKNKAFEKTIERLKSVERQLEQKRKSFK